MYNKRTELKLYQNKELALTIWRLANWFMVCIHHPYSVKPASCAMIGQWVVFTTIQPIEPQSCALLTNPNAGDEMKQL